MSGYGYDARWSSTVVLAACCAAVGSAGGVFWTILNAPGVSGCGILYVAGVAVPLTVTDTRQFRLPNTLVLPGYLVCAFGILSAGGENSDMAVLAPLLVLAAGLALAREYGLGMGDVKLVGLMTAALLSALAPEGRGDDMLVRALLWLMFTAMAVYASSVLLRWSTRHRDGDIAVGPLLLGAFWTALALP